MIDFTSCEVNKFKAYGGANGNKIHIKYQGNGYMLKFPPIPGRSKIMSYTNSCISEYLACHIYNLLGIEVQETLLGTYTDRRGKEKVVVACRDFTENGKRLIEFAQLKNTCIDSEQNGYGTELSSIMTAIDEQPLFKQTAMTAPVYDCGSCLYPQLAVEEMQGVLDSEEEINKRIFVYPTSAIEEEGKKVSYFDFISSLKDSGCNAALKRICERIDMERIDRLVEETPFLKPIQKEFYRIMIRERKEKILDYSMNLYS